MDNSFDRLRHQANEYADMATNGVQWLRNIRDGISTVDEALAEMESNLTRIRSECESKMDARQQGWIAGKAGNPKSSNPYPVSVVEHRKWADAWELAQRN